MTEVLASERGAVWAKSPCLSLPTSDSSSRDTWGALRLPQGSVWWGDRGGEVVETSIPCANNWTHYRPPHNVPICQKSLPKNTLTSLSNNPFISGRKHPEILRPVGRPQPTGITSAQGMLGVIGNLGGLMAARQDSKYSSRTLPGCSGTGSASVRAISLGKLAHEGPQ